jgi:hypothetical protein
MAVLTEGTGRRKGNMIYRMNKTKLQNWIDHQGGETYIIEDGDVALIISDGDVAIARDGHVWRGSLYEAVEIIAILAGHEEVVKDGVEMYADRHMSEVKHVHP